MPFRTKRSFGKANAEPEPELLPSLGRGPEQAQDPPRKGPGSIFKKSGKWA